MATLVPSKYSLRTLHEEIALLDRKLAHLLKYEEFSNDVARQQAAGRIEHKRELLVRSAQSMVQEGVEFQVSDVPASMRSEELGAEPSAEAAPAPVEAPVPLAPRKRTRPASPFSGTVLDGGHALELYKQEKQNRKPAALGRRSKRAADPVAVAV